MISIIAFLVSTSMYLREPINTQRSVFFFSSLLSIQCYRLATIWLLIYHNNYFSSFAAISCAMNIVCFGAHVPVFSYECVIANPSIWRFNVLMTTEHFSKWWGCYYLLTWKLSLKIKLWKVLPILIYQSYSWFCWLHLLNNLFSKIRNASLITCPISLFIWIYFWMWLTYLLHAFKVHSIMLWCTSA